MRAIGGMMIAVAIAIAVAMTGCQRAYSPPTLGEVSDVVRLHNRERVDEGLGRLVEHPDLSAAAQDWAEHMATVGTLYHSRPTPGFTLWGENVAEGASTPKEAVDLWMSSPGHRANILSSRYRLIGVGRADNWWCVQFAARGPSDDGTGVIGE